MLTADAQYAANVAALTQNPAMHGFVHQMAQTPLVNLQMLPTETGALAGCIFDIATQSWLPLCDMNDPIGNAEDVAMQAWSPQQSVYTIMGVGLGYIVAAIAKRLLPYQRMVIWDVEASLFKAMLHAIDIRGIFDGKRVEIYVGNDLPQRIDPWYMGLEVHEKLHMAFPASHSYTSIYRKAEYQALMDRIMEMMRFHMVGLATWRQFGRCIGDNDIENMPEYYANPGMLAMKDLWKDKPAVCVAAGPSLRKNLKHLLPSKQRSKVALLTVGTTYALMQGLGLQPDIVTTIDFQRLNWTDQFQSLPLDPDCALLYLHSTYPQTVRRWPGPCFVAENSSDTIAWIRQYAEEKGQAGMVQTVAHLNVVAALTMGANPIILLGQDLSMPSDEHHASGARAQDQSPGESQPEAFMDAVDMHGKPTKTRHSFMSMKLVFERLIAEHPETTFINASEQGLKLEGAQHMPLAHVLSMLPDAQCPSQPMRPLFQGETAQQSTAMPPPLRALLKQTYDAYAPGIKDTFAADFNKICQDVEDIGQWACDTCARWADVERVVLSEQARQVALSSDCLSDAEVREETACLPLYQEIIESEKVLQERQHATGMFVIRRFDFIELKGEIPPPADELRYAWQQARYSANRLAKAATMFLEELPQVQQLLRRAHRRMQHATDAPRALVRQRYRHAIRLIAGRMIFDELGRSGTPMPARMQIRLLAQCYRHTQQYEAALALLRLWQSFSTADALSIGKRAARIHAHLAQYYADVRHAMPAYFHEDAPAGFLGASSRKPAHEEVLGDTTHAWATYAASSLAVEQVLRSMPFFPLTGTNGHHSPAPPVQDEAGTRVHG